MTNFKKIAIAGGTGVVGQHVVREFLESDQFQITVLSRSVEYPENKELLEKGADVIQVDYSDENSLVEALAGIDVVISAINCLELDNAQLTLVSASKKSGVSRFVPSEFGLDVKKKHDPFHDQKMRTRDKINELGLSYTYYTTGFFMDQLVSPYYGFHIDDRKVDFVGDGYTQFTTTSLKDIGQFMVQTINLPQSNNAELLVSGETTSFYKVSRQLENLLNFEFERKYIDIEEAQTMKKDNESDFLISLHYDLRLIMDRGDGINKYDHTSLASRLQPISVLDFLKRSYLTN